MKKSLITLALAAAGLVLAEGPSGRQGQRRRPQGDRRLDAQVIRIAANPRAGTAGLFLAKRKKWLNSA